MKAITATDAAVGTVYKACEAAGYVLLVTADHGNAEQMQNAETGEPHTAHTTNKVPLIMTGDATALAFAEDTTDGDKEEGALCDVAPTILSILVSWRFFVVCLLLVDRRSRVVSLRSTGSPAARR